VIQQISHSDGFPVGRKFRENFRQRLVVAQLAVVHQQHNGHGRELLSAGSQPEICGRVDRLFVAQVAQAIALSEQHLPVLFHEHGKARPSVRSQTRILAVQLFPNLIGPCSLLPRG
jgi:hypothetical protein